MDADRKTAQLTELFRLTGTRCSFVLMLALCFIITSLSGCEPATEHSTDQKKKVSFHDTFREFIGEDAQDSEKVRNKAPRAPKERTVKRERTTKVRKAKVIVYVTRDCELCKQTEHFLKENKIGFRRVDVERSASGREFYAKMHGGELPIVAVDEEIVRGYQPKAIFQLITKPQGAKFSSDSNIVRF